MQVNRRDWLKKVSLAGGLMLSGGVALPTLTAEEKRKFHPRPLQDLVRLSSNENPYGPSEFVRQAISKAYDISCRYPSAYSKELISKIAQKEGVSEDHIVVTGGSTEGLKLTGLTYAANGGKIIAGKPTFLAMMSFAEKMGATTDWVPVDETLTYDLDEIDKRIDGNTSLVFLCNQVKIFLSYHTKSIFSLYHVELGLFLFHYFHACYYFSWFTSVALFCCSC